MTKKQGITIGKTRTALYETARVLGDVNAVSRGTIPQRLVSRVVGSLFSRLTSSLIRALFGKN